MAPSYLVKKSDFFYFRHYIPTSIQKIVGKKEYLLSLRVSRKPVAIQIAREIKIVFDSVMKNVRHDPLITWKEIRKTVDNAFDIIYQKYIDNYEIHGPSHKDEYEPLNFIPPEYEELVLTKNYNISWGDVGKLYELADKICKWSNIKLEKGTKEYNLFCFCIIEALYKHSHRKLEPHYYERMEHNNIIEKPSDSTKFQINQDNIVINTNSNNGNEKENKTESCLDDARISSCLSDCFADFIIANTHAWSKNTKKEYFDIFRNLIIPILELATNKKEKDISTNDLNINVANFYYNALLHVPAQFTKRFSGKMTLEQAINYSKDITSGKKIDVDIKLYKYLQDKIKPTTLNRKYISLLRQFFEYLEKSGFIEKNWLSGRSIKDSQKKKSTYRPFDKKELETIFHHPIFRDKKIIYKKNEYGNMIPYFKYWIPIICLYSGEREGEVAQLRTKDFIKKDEVHLMNITPSEDTSIKNISSIRTVPIHPVLISLGILKYTEWLNRKNEKFLFPELSSHKDKSGAVSKWFLRFLKKNCNIVNDIPNTQLVLHSFRNNFCDEYKQKGEQDYYAGETMGHKTQGITYGVYGSKLNIDLLYEKMIKCVTYEDVSFPWNDKHYYQSKVFPWD